MFIAGYYYEIISESNSRSNWNCSDFSKLQILDWTAVI